MSDPESPLTTPDLLAKSTENLDFILANSHPLMVEAFYLASVPQWYDLPLFAAIRDKADGREEGLIDRLKRYSFISPLYYREEAGPACFVRAQERAILQRRWIAEDLEAYKAAHQRALAFWEDHPDPNPFAQAQNRLYHLLFVNFDKGIEYLVDRFRTYRNERHFPAIERLLNVAREAQEYLTLQEDRSVDVDTLDQLLTYLGVRLAQLRGNWKDSERDLQTLRQKGDRLDSRLRPYVLRALGYNRSHKGKYSDAIQSLKEALAEFDQQPASDGESPIIHAEWAYTMIALGDAHEKLAASVGGYHEREQLGPGLGHRLRAGFYFFLSLPLVLYLSWNLGRRVWHPQFWPALIGLDWIIGRLFATAARYYRQADPILEKYGEPAEGVVADEKLASLYLRLGDAQHAKRHFSRLLIQEEAPLGPYRQASARVGLGDAYLQLGQAELALEPLRTALPVLAAYGDRELGARARELLGEALFARGEEKEAIKHFGTSCHSYQERDDWIGATRIVERLEEWVQVEDLAEAARQQAKQVISSLGRRQYPGGYRHPLLVRFRQLMLILLPVVVILVPLLTITVDTPTGLAPEIRFRPPSLLFLDETVSVTLSQGVVAANVSRVVVSDMLLRIAVMLIIAYLVLSLVLGWAAIAFTPLDTVEARGRGATVCLNDQHIAVGQETAICLDDQDSVLDQETSAPSLPWIGVSRFVKANVSMWHRPLQDGSSFGLGATQEPLLIGGSTRWYTSLRERVSRLVPAEVQVIDRDYSILRSPLGALYILNLLFVVLLGALAKFRAGKLILYDLPGIQYSAVDFYPYLYFFLVVAPMWWGVVQPLRQRIYLKPYSRSPIWLLGAGLLLAFVQVLLHFRPLLTVVNLYLPLITIILLVSAEIALWRAQVAGKKVHPAPVRLGTAVVVIGVCLLMVSVGWREMRAYHYLVHGNFLRDSAQNPQGPEPVEDLLEEAISAYGRASDIGSEAVWGLDTRSATRIRVAIPAPSSFTWLRALTSQAALQTRLGKYDEAIQSFDEVLKFTDRPDVVYAWRALAHLTEGIRPLEEGNLEINRAKFELAIRDLDSAVQLNGAEAPYYLWRGVAYHALGYVLRGAGSAEEGQPDPLSEAFYNYQRALESRVAGEASLTPEQRAQLLTGLGWISYESEDFQESLERFQDAKKANPQSPDVWLGEGYALYALGRSELGRLEEALPVWEEAARLDPKDPIVLISLGTLHWKLGKTGQVLGRDSCEEYGLSADYFSQAVDEDKMRPQRDTDVAYTYRTLAHVQYLLAACFDSTSDKVAKYHAAVKSYSKAIRRDPEVAHYWYRRGRLAYSIADTLRPTAASKANEWLLKAIADVGQAIELDQNQPVYWHDRGWLAYYAWNWGAMTGLEAQKWLLRGLADLEKAVKLDQDDRDVNYRPNSWIERIRPEAIDGGLDRGDDHFVSGDYATALAYYKLVANNVPENAKAAFKVGLTSLALRNQEEALVWYEKGLERTRSTNEVVEAQVALQELTKRAPELNLRAEAVLALFQEHGVTLEVEDPQTAFVLGLAALQLEDQDRALAWYREGIERALGEEDLATAKDAVAELMLMEDKTLQVYIILALFLDHDIEPDNAQQAFTLALASRIGNDLKQSTQLYNQGLELAVTAGDIEVVKAAAYELRDFLLEHPDMSRADFYWPLHDSLAVRERTVAKLAHPHLYWRYRAEIGFRLLADGKLFREKPGQEESYELIYSSIIADIERAYALKPDEDEDELRKMRDFFVDANIGWLYLRRGDYYTEGEDYEQALADYEEATRRIRPASEDAARDLTEATFKAGLTALRLEQFEPASAWYDEGIELLEDYGTRFDLNGQLDDAVKALQALSVENTDLRRAIAPILEELEKDH